MDRVSAGEARVKVLFLVQGEGRGHLTQALALEAMLARAGHRVVASFVGRSDQRELPPFFTDALAAPLHRLDSPNFVYDAQHRGLRHGATLWRNLTRLPCFRAALDTLDAAYQRYRPDVVVNFLEPIGGVYQLLVRPRVPVVCVGHQYLVQHPAFPFPPGRLLERSLLRGYVALTAWGAAARLALSFSPLPGDAAAGLYVVPPLLRPEVLALPLGMQEPFILVYLLNHGYADEVRRWHARHPQVPLHCFWDHPEAPEVLVENAALTFHRLNAARFLNFMACCMGVVCTAGFESVCEAAYLGKPVLMVPVQGHYEQACNAYDAQRAGVGADRFSLDSLLGLLQRFESPAPAFRAWVNQAEARCVAAIEAAADRRALRCLSACLAN